MHLCTLLFNICSSCLFVYLYFIYLHIVMIIMSMYLLLWMWTLSWHKEQKKSASGFCPFFKKLGLKCLRTFNFRGCVRPTCVLQSRGCFYPNLPVDKTFVCHKKRGLKWRVCIVTGDSVWCDSRGAFVRRRGNAFPGVRLQAAHVTHQDHTTCLETTNLSPRGGAGVTG